METRGKISRRHFVRVAASLPAGLLVGMPEVAGSRENPLADAIALWHMGETGDRTAAKAGIRIHGDVKLGVPLGGAEREASLRRGGDGKVAEFRGGYLSAGRKGATPDLSGKKQMTLCLRVRDPEGKWDTPLLSHEAPEDRLAGILYSTGVNRPHLSYEAAQRARQGKALEFVWRTEPAEDRVKPEYFNYELSKHFSRNQDFMDGVLRLQAPMELIGPDRWHDVVVRFRNANLELFVDGVLVDEEWPHGALHGFRGPFLVGAGYRQGSVQSGFHGQIDHLALWDRALSDEEVGALSGGEAEIARRRRELLGLENPSLQYWRPRGFNTFVGDCMPAYYDGEFHLHYLFDRRHHRSKWGMGAHQFAHASSKDLVHWTHHPMTVKITEQWECSIGTGIIVPHQGTYHAFYIQHGRRCWFKDAPHDGDTIHVATSADGLQFRKDSQPVVPWVYVRRQDGDPGDINPDIFPDHSGSRFYLSLSGEKIWVSGDLKEWEEARGFDTFKDIGKGICSSYFHWNGWYYLMSSGSYRMSREPLKPGWSWTQPEDPATQEGLGVPEVAAFKGNRYLMVGFLGGTAYAGEVIFRELVQHEDGVLGTKWPVEMIPRSGGPLKLTFEPLDKGAVYNGGGVRITAPVGFSAGVLKGVPQDARITLRVKPAAGVRAFGLCVRGEGAYAGGCELRFEPARRRVQYGTPADGGMAPDSKANGYGADFGIESISGLDRAFQLDVIVKSDFVDSCIDNRRTIISRRPDRPQGDRLFFFANGGEVSFEDVTVSPLV
jgi:beta-fructofuranosidase